MPNIWTERQKHLSWCRQPAYEVSDWGAPGDVRRCPHGKIQMGYEVRGTIPPYWSDLSWFWSPIRYVRARRALR